MKKPAPPLNRNTALGRYERALREMASIVERIARSAPDPKSPKGRAMYDALARKEAEVAALRKEVA